MSDLSTDSRKFNKEDYFDLKEFAFLCLNKWRWFVLSLVVTLGLAITYILITPPTYTRHAELLIKDNSSSNSYSGSLDDTFASMGIVPTIDNVKNEIIALQSPDLMYEVVERLKLDVSYSSDGMFHKVIVYGDDLPVNVEFLDLTAEDYASMTMEVNADGSLLISDIVKNSDPATQSALTAKVDKTIKTSLGKIKISRTDFYDKIEKPMKLYIQKYPRYAFANGLSGNFSVSLCDEDVSVVDLSYNDGCKQRGDDILNAIITVYNENWVNDKNRIAVSSSLFIEDRLNVIERELGNVDKDISEYKSKNLLPDLQAVSKLYMDRSSKANEKITELSNKLYMAQFIREYIVDKKKTNQLLPANSGVGNGNIESQIDSYNQKLLQRNSLVANSSEENPLVVDLDLSLRALRSAIITSIDHYTETLNSEMRSQLHTEQVSTSRIAANPSQAKYLLSVERQQQVKEALYLFLLKKREENELSQAFTSYNTRLITKPHGSNVPTKPVKKSILLAAFVFALALPAGLIFILANTNSKIRGRKDLEGLTIPFIGEIPLCFKPKKGKFNKKQVAAVNPIVVKQGSRNIINEAFRILRTNIEFMADKDRKSNVFMVASFNPDSGKTFITMNTAASMAIKGKKVLLIDGDMRHASLSKFLNSPKLGLSNYLAGYVDNYSDIIYDVDGFESMKVLPVGTIPPNPTELLYNEELKILIDNLRSEFDFIIIDCPPIDIVADTQIIEKVIDRTIFVVRAGLMERSLVKKIQEISDENKYKKMCLVLNGTSSTYGGYGSQYGYRYGYHYGYYGKNAYPYEDEN